MLRQAIQLVLDEEEIMGVATDGLFKLNPSFVYTENEFYPKRAKELVPVATKALETITNKSFKTNAEWEAWWKKEGSDFKVP